MVLLLIAWEGLTLFGQLKYIMTEIRENFLQSKHFPRTKNNHSQIIKIHCVVVFKFKCRMYFMFDIDQHLFLVFIQMHCKMSWRKHDIFELLMQIVSYLSCYWEKLPTNNIIMKCKHMGNMVWIYCDIEMYFLPFLIQF